MDLHSLPPQGDIRPSQLMAKLINTLPHGTDTNSILFLCLECLSISAKCWPRTSTPAPTTWQSPPTASGTCANRPPPPPTDPASGPRRRASTAATPTTAATPAAPPTAAAHRAGTAVEPRPPIRNFQMIVIFSADILQFCLIIMQVVLHEQGEFNNSSCLRYRIALFVV